MEDKRGRGRGRGKGRGGRDRGIMAEEDYLKNPATLLAFTLPERERVRGPSAQYHAKSYIPYKKERHVQANYRLSVAPNYDISLGYRNANMSVFDGSIDNVNRLVSWEDVVHVTYTTYKPYECSICLFTPTCPRITPCGHIFCWTCAIQYFSMKHFFGVPNASMMIKHSCPCPVCTASFDLTELRSVEIEQRESTETKNVRRFAHLSREKLSTVILYPENSIETYAGSLPLPLPFPSRRTAESRMNRVTIAFAEDMEEIWEKEEKELTTALDEALSSSDPSSPIHIFSKDIFDKQRSDFRNNEHKYIPYPTHIQKEEKTTDKPSQSTRHYFYQMDTGENVYLHPLDTTWLQREFGDPCSFPPFVEGVVLDIEDEITQDEQTQKRYRFLGHLPVSCNFRFCLLDISPLLSPENAKGFKAAIKHRKQQLLQQRKERLQQEKRQLEEAQNYAAMRSKETISGISQSQARLYEKLCNLETVTNDEVNFPSLADEEERKAEERSQRETMAQGNAERRWDNSDSFRQRLEELSDYTPVLARESQFPTLGGSSVASTSAPKPAASTPWGAKSTTTTTTTTSAWGKPTEPAGRGRGDQKSKRGKAKRQVIFSNGM
eukprot:TRINITY_DN249_c0_g1_i1.p1 TRINITY_DN249_c0_g1~~TRINITY_DN249_c0_g1_i1.p1  ORF type:complete len:617 (-),score=112.02 TRINITY_DN249_c0_g1_i1:113-1933(-)